MRRRISIGIPAYNEEQDILNILQSLEVQNAHDLTISEVLVSDDSSDSTPNIINQFAACSSLNVTLFHHTERRGTAAAWNEIFKQAKGDIIVLYDADTIPHPLCTKHLASRIEGKVGLSASNSQPVQSTGIAGKASVFISNWLRSVRLAGLSQYTVMGRALAIDSSLAKSIQIPADLIAIDLYLQCRVLEMGMDIVYNDDAIVYFKPANRMQDLTSQVVRAINGHNQIKDYASKFKIDLPAQVAFMEVVKNSMRDPIGALSVAIGYLAIPYYRSSLTGTGSAKWHIAESSKAIDYRQLKARF